MLRIKLHLMTYSRTCSVSLAVCVSLLAGCNSTTAAGGSTPAATQQLTLSAGSITFPSTVIGQTAVAQSVTVTNSGSSAVTLPSITLTGANGINFTETTTCAGTLAASASCTITSSFAPTASGSYTASIVISSNGTGSPQTIALSGTGTTPAPTPTQLLTLSAPSLSFTGATVGQTTAAQSVTVTSAGNAPVTLQSITLGGTGSANFARTTTCGSTLAAAATCTISVIFTPTASGSSSATITITSSATGSPQTIALSGTSSSTSLTHTLYVFPESDNSVTPLYTMINNAQKTIDMTMYELQDTIFSGDLVSACARGVVVRVILSSSESSSNKPAYTQLNTAGTNCSAVLSNTAFTNTHQKTITIDGVTTAILSLNLQTQYYSTTRDFALVENDPVDIAAIEATFNADYVAGTPYNGTQGVSDFGYAPGAGTDLIWSPTTAQAAMLGLINNATTSLLIENEEMSASNIVSALVAACTRKVTVHIAMVNSSDYTTNFNALTAAGCGLYLYPNTATGFYVHAKAVVADYGLPTQKVYMGSINYSNASMNNNRELGTYITDPTAITTLYTTMSQDYTGNPVF